jgi:hypothetical protein
MRPPSPFPSRGRGFFYLPIEPAAVVASVPTGILFMFGHVIGIGSTFSFGHVVESRPPLGAHSCAPIG